MFKHIDHKEWQMPGYIFYHADWCRIVSSNTYENDQQRRILKYVGLPAGCVEIMIFALFVYRFASQG